MTVDALEALAVHALGFVRADTILGLGAGRAPATSVRALGERVRAGLRVLGVPASEETAALARKVGVPLVGLDSELELTVDGADEVDPQLNLIKGYGGALVRERIVAAAARRRVILVTADKLVGTLGGRGVLPVEVLPFAVPFCRRQLETLGLTSRLRTVDDRPFVTDNSNVIIDLRIEPIADAPALERSIRSIPGVVDTGLFLEMADTVLVADGGSVRVLTRQQG